MDQSRILIIGAYGQLGKALQNKYPEATAVDRDSFDMTDWEMLENYDWAKYDTILNAAAYTNVDGAETNEGRSLSWSINAVGPSYLSKVASTHDLKIVHISSEYVFDGTKSPHLEDEFFTPLGVYAQTKAAGDISVALAPKHYILRTSWVIGEGKNFVQTMLGVAEKNIEPTVVGDQIGRLTFTTELVRGIDHLLGNDLPYGTYNLSNEGDSVSWADVTREIFKIAGYDLKVTDTTTAEYFEGKEGISPRPLQSTLSLDKIHSTGFKSNNWREDLEHYIKAVQGAN